MHFVLFYKFNGESIFASNLLIKFFWCVAFGYLYFLSFQQLNEQGMSAGIDPGMTLHHFHLALDEIQNHDLPIVS